MSDNQQINLAAANQQKNGFILRPENKMKPITFDQAKEVKIGTTFYHRTMTNRDGTPMRARVQGAVKTWKTRPDAVRIPMKRGLRDSFQIGQGDTDKLIDQPLENWSLTEQ